MQITEAELVSDIEKIRKGKDQLVANLNQLIGREQTLVAILERMKQPEPVEKPATTVEKDATEATGVEGE